MCHISKRIAQNLTQDMLLLLSLIIFLFLSNLLKTDMLSEKVILLSPPHLLPEVGCQKKVTKKVQTTTIMQSVGIVHAKITFLFFF